MMRTFVCELLFQVSKSFLVGFLNCTDTYINTLHAESQIDSLADIYQHYLAKYSDYLIQHFSSVVILFAMGRCRGFKI